MRDVGGKLIVADLSVVHPEVVKDLCCSNSCVLYTVIF